MTITTASIQQTATSDTVNAPVSATPPQLEPDPTNVMHMPPHVVRRALLEDQLRKLEADYAATLKQRDEAVRIAQECDRVALRHEGAIAMTRQILAAQDAENLKNNVVPETS